MSQPQAAADDHHRIAAQIRDAFQGTVAPVAVQARYRWGMAFACAAILLLPLAYFAVIAAAAYGTYAYLAWWFYDAGGHAHNLRGVALALSPAFALAATVLFLLKAILPRFDGEPFHVTLSRDDEPTLHELVERIADAVGAPRPREIRLTFDANASASLRRGLLSFFGRDLVLSLGLPLIAAANTRHLAGVIAHELGHFSQGAGLRVTYLIMRVNRWLFDASFRPDGLDHWLAQQQAEAGVSLAGIISAICRLMIKIARFVCGVFFRIGYGLATAFTRQMEFDADRYEARVAGSEHFAATSEVMTSAALMHHVTMRDLAEAWHRREVPDDVVQWASHRLQKLTPETRRELVALYDVLPSTRYDTHPPTPERIANARAEKTDGIFRLELPAQLLTTTAA